jgi:hypothetical protein
MEPEILLPSSPEPTTCAYPVLISVVYISGAEHIFCINVWLCTVEPGYNDIGLYDTSYITSDIL